MSDYKLSKYNFFKQFDDNTYVCCNLVEKVFFWFKLHKISPTNNQFRQSLHL